MASEAAASIRGALVECLGMILTAQTDGARRSAEERLRLLEVTNEFGIYLAEFTVSPESDLSGRQLASLVLKQYVEQHWSRDSEKFQEPETPAEAKTTIRSLLPRGLADPSSKVRSTVAYAISKIAQWDWPDHWPNLFEMLVQFLNSPNADLVHGTMRVLAEISRDLPLSDTQLPGVVRLIMPQLFQIFMNAEGKFSVRTRSRAVEIFSTLTQGIFMIKNDDQADVAKALLKPFLPPFIKALAEGLTVPDDGEKSDVGLRREIFKALFSVMGVFPKLIKQEIRTILPPIWQVLTSSADVYVRTVVNNDDVLENAVDSEGEALTFENLLQAVFDFVIGLVEMPTFHKIVVSFLPQLVYFSLIYMQITEDETDAWTKDLNDFIQDEDEETMSYSVRLASKDLLMQLFQPTKVTVLSKQAPFALVSAIGKVFEQAAQARRAGASGWWKLYEVVFMTITDHVDSLLGVDGLQFDLNTFFATYVVDLLEVQSSPFLIGRALQMASTCTLNLAPELVTRFIQATVNGLQTTDGVVRVLSAKAVAEFCSQLHGTERTVLLKGFMGAILEALVGMVSLANHDVLQLMLDTLVISIMVAPEETARLESRICPLAVGLLFRHSQDHVLVDTLKDIFVQLVQNPACIGPLHQRLVPALASILQNVQQAPPFLLAAALDILAAIVRHTPTPLPKPLLDNCATTAAVIMATDDSMVMQNGGECLRAFVSTSCDQLLEWRDANEQTALDYIVEATCQMLQPSRIESSARFIDRLICVLVWKVGDGLQSKLEDILRGVLSKLQQATQDLVVQSLVTVFARLLHGHLNNVLDFLDSVPGPSGSSALSFVLTKWCQTHSYYYAYERHACVIGLCELLRHGLNTNDPRLQAIVVPGDEIFEEGQGVRTRSKAANAPRRFTIIPVLAKVFKLLVGELNYQAEVGAARAREVTTVALRNSGEAAEAVGGVEGEEGEWEDEDDDEDDDGLDNFNLSDLLAASSDFEDFDDPLTSQDPDLSKDVIMQIDLPKFLSDFLRDICQQPCFPALSEHLTNMEKEALRSLVIVAPR